MARVSNIEQFLREVRHDIDWIENVDAPRKLAKLTLEVAQTAADLSPRGAPATIDGQPAYNRRSGALSRSWSAGQEIRPRLSQVGIEKSRAALAKPTLAKPWFVYSLDFIASWHEYGTVHLRATPMLGPALQRVGSRVVP